MGSIKVDKEWDAVLMVLLDQNFDAVEIYEAERVAVVAVLAAPGSKARNERGAMAVSKFKSIGRLRCAETIRRRRERVMEPGWPFGNREAPRKAWALCTRISDFVVVVVSQNAAN